MNKVKIQINEKTTKKEFLKNMSELFDEVKNPKKEDVVKKLNKEKIQLQGQNYLLKHNLSIKTFNDRNEIEVNKRLLYDYSEESMKLRKELIRCELYLESIEGIFHKMKDLEGVPKEVIVIIEEYFGVVNDN